MVDAQPQEAQERLPAFPATRGTVKSRHRLVASTVQQSPSAHCAERGCDWEQDPAPYAQATAFEHCQETGHRVTVQEITQTSIEVMPS